MKSRLFLVSPLLETCHFLSAVPPLFRHGAILFSVLLLCSVSPADAAVVFNEGFSGSTVMAASPAAPTSNSTDYTVLSSKNASGSTLLNLNLSSGTSSGFGEMQALFTAPPVTLAAGGSITLQMTFQGTHLMDKSNGDSQTLNVGLFNSGGSYPVPGGQMANGGMGTGTSFVSGYARDWQGFVARIGNPSGSNGSEIYTRDPQADTTDENQDVLFSNVGTGAYDVPPGQTVASSATRLNLTDGADYTLVFTVTNNGSNILVSEQLYEGAGTGGTMVYSLSGTAPSGHEYDTFDSLAFGARFSASSAPAINVSALSVDHIAGPAAAPAISDLDDVTASVDDNVTLIPTVTGSPAPTYQWQENGFNMAGETNATLTLLSVQTNQDGNVYTLMATNSVGADTDSMTLTVTEPSLPLPVFPGAEGAGAGALGGRGGDVYYVTNLADSGAGSLRYGISSATGPRTILFKVSGNILLGSNLSINKPYLTIAGQTAPGDGITLQGWTTSVQDTHDVVVRYIRARPGDINGSAFQDDSFHFVRATNCVADHVSASWSIDETLSCTHYSTNITVQWCFITESLNDSFHDKGPHGYGSLIRYGNGAVTYHHNLYSDHRSRNPRLGDNIKLDFVNNVIYNWGDTAGYNANDSGDNPSGFTNVLNYVGNYLVAGPNTGSPNTAFDSGVVNASHFQLYQSGNRIDSNKDGILNGTNTGPAMFKDLYTVLGARYPLPQVSTDSAKVGYERVLAFGGASAMRDAVDARVVNEVIQQIGAIIDSQDDVGGFPALSSDPAPTDSDNDGIPDYWEEVLGWNPGVPNNNHVNPDGYTDLEWYLNWLAEPHAVCTGNASVDVDLRQATGGLTNLTFAVSNGTNGTATLLGDGYTARFVPAVNFTGLADFNYSCSNTVTSTGFGPVTVGVAVEEGQPILLWDGVAGGLELSWPGGWVLQYLTDSLTNGAGWLTYPDTNNPVVVPYDYDAAFFRLSE